MARVVIGSIALAILLVLDATHGVAASGVRDVGAQIGLPRRVTTWDAEAADLDRDGWLDLVISYHEDGAVFYRSDSGIMVEAARTPIADVHGCSATDVDGPSDGNGFRDVFCTVGARQGTAVKANQLWIQTTRWNFEDRAEDRNVTDPFGRGRHPTFLHLDDDRAPDLFIGNEYPRQDKHPSPNRTYLNDGAGVFAEVDVGVTAEEGGACADTADVDLDGRQDLLVCGARLLLYRNVSRPALPLLRDRAGASGIDIPRPRSGLVVRLTDDRLPGIVVIRARRLFIFRQSPRWQFHLILNMRLRDARWVAAGDVDGRHGTDLYVVQGCGRRASDHPDLLLLNDGGSTFDIERRRGVRHGCGHLAVTGDLDRDGKDEVIVLNGLPQSQPGPVQVLTKGAFRA